MSESMSPGWYTGSDGSKSYWDGQAWVSGPEIPERAQPDSASGSTTVTPEPKSRSPWAALGRSRGERIGFGIAALFVVALVIALVRPFGGGSSPSAGAPAYNPAPIVDTEPRRIRYELDGDGVTQADITYATPSGTSQQQDIDVPMRSKAGEPGIEKRFAVGAFVYFSAQIKTGSGSITCRIVNADDGTVISSNMASGSYAIATCKGSAR